MFLSLFSNHIVGPWEDAFLVVGACLKGVLEGARGYGKSPCFLGLQFLGLVSPDCLGLKLGVVDGAEFLD